MMVKSNHGEQLKRSLKVLAGKGGKSSMRRKLARHRYLSDLSGLEDRKMVATSASYNTINDL